MPPDDVLLEIFHSYDVTMNPSYIDEAEMEVCQSLAHVCRK